MTDQSVYDAIADTASVSPGAACLLAPGRTACTYRDLQQQVEYVRTQLDVPGVGQRVAVDLADGAEAAAALLSIAATKTAVPINVLATEVEQFRALKTCKADSLLVDNRYDGPLRRVAQSLGLATLELHSKGKDRAGMFTLSAVNSQHRITQSLQNFSEPALILATSGTTAAPKAVPITHANLLASCRHIASAFHLAFSNRRLNVMPLCHVYGMIETSSQISCADWPPVVRQVGSVGRAAMPVKQPI